LENYMNTFKRYAFHLSCAMTILIALPTLAQALPCVVPDAGGTADLPPIGCIYTTPDVPTVNDLSISAGLPFGSTIEIDSNLHTFTGVVQAPGGGLGGETQTYQASLDMPMIGTGAMAGFNRNIVLPLSFVQSHSAPRIAGTTPQIFLTDMFQMQGQITGDPDFDLLRVTAGTGFGMPSPGSTTLTRLGPPGSSWNVDSFFDITYRIDFVGRAGGQLSGMSGSTTGMARFVVGNLVPEPASLAFAMLSGIVVLVNRRTRQ
jgi:hypothetical protein